MIAEGFFNFVEGGGLARSLSEGEIGRSKRPIDAEVGVIPRKSAFTVRGPRVCELVDNLAIGL